MTDEPSIRILAIQKSLAGFACGIIGFIPIVGFFPALYALGCLLAVRGRCRNQWNPASAYLVAGAVLAVIGLLGSALILSVAALTFVAHQFN